MKYLLLIVFLLIAVCVNCQQRSLKNTATDKEWYRGRFLRFSEMPIEILVNLEKMGVDSSSILNEYEISYLNVIFNIDTLDFNFAGKMVDFNHGGKNEFFKDERERFFNNLNPVSASLYIFNDEQKVRTGGYDAAIVSWSIFILPIERVVKAVIKRHRKKKIGMKGTRTYIIYYDSVLFTGSVSLYSRYEKLYAKGLNEVQELSYDVWGRLRNPANQVPYGPGSEPTLYLGRGYTEHLSQFGKINMNARLYDPSTGRFIYPDPVVQDPSMSQNYNRYAYCLNNPLKYTDPSGEKWWHWVIGILAGTSVTSFTAASVIAGSAMITAGFMTGSAMIVMGTTLGSLGSLPAISASASATDFAVSFNTLYFGDMEEGEDRFSNWFQIEGQKPYAFAGTFRYDNSASWNEWLLQVINNLGGGEFFQDNLGNIYAHYLNMTGKIDAIGRYEGRTIIRTPVGTVNDGISLGHYIFGDNIALNPNDSDGHNIG